MEREEPGQRGTGTGQEAPDANDRRGGYLGFVAHEVRNPLSTALWTAELLTRMSPEERGGARGDKLSAMCLRSLSRVRQLIEDHFMCERLDVGGIPVRAESLVVGEVIDGLLDRRPTDSPPVAVDLEGPIVATADRTLLERVIESLLAVVGTDDTAARVIARADADLVEISFSGHKPPSGALEDPRKGSPSDPKGRALALPVARRAAEALGGTLAISEDQYVLTLPRAKTYTPAPDSPAEP